MSIYILFFCFFKASKESEQVEIAPTAEEPVKRTSRRGKSEPEKTTSKRKASPSPIKEEQEVISPPKKARATRGKAAAAEAPAKDATPAKKARATRGKAAAPAKTTPVKRPASPVKAEAAVEEQPAASPPKKGRATRTKAADKATPAKKAETPVKAATSTTKKTTRTAKKSKAAEKSPSPVKSSPVKKATPKKTRATKKSKAVEKSPSPVKAKTPAKKTRGIDYFFFLHWIFEEKSRFVMCFLKKSTIQFNFSSKNLNIECNFSIKDGIVTKDIMSIVLAFSLNLEKIYYIRTILIQLINVF